MNINDALEILKNHGYKLTGKREELIKVFAVEERYLTAKEVLEQLQQNFPSLSFDTIYRNLSLFVKLDILEMTEWEGEKKFRFRCGTKTHHHHVICMSCGATKEIHNCPMDHLCIVDDGFVVFDHKFEVYGLCNGCNHENNNRLSTSVNL